MVRSQDLGAFAEWWRLGCRCCGAGQLDSEFLDEPGGLRHALDLLQYAYPCVGPLDLPSKLSETGLGSRAMQHLPAGAASMTKIAGERWYRSVAANPNADIKLLISGLRKALYEVRLA
jgi:hypothetical protein